MLIEDTGQVYLAEQDPDDVLAPLQAAACTYRIAFGPRKGQKVLSLQTVPPGAPEINSPRCVSDLGFSLHANTACGAEDRSALERLCRYITRPALSYKRVKLTEQGKVVLKLKSPYRDGTTHLVMEPLEFLQRLAALVPRPRLNLIRYHGVLAPNAKLRALVVPNEKTPVTPEPGESDIEQHTPNASRMSWARLLKRVFAIDIEICPDCQGRLKILAAIESPDAIEKILTCLGLPAQPPPIAPADRLDLFQDY